ncbi:MAG: hypothetical protein U0869_24140 [Chloroflexota bacterium]
MRQVLLGLTIATAGALAIAGTASATTPGTNKALVYLTSNAITFDPDGAGPKDGQTVLTPVGKVTDVEASPDGTRIAYAVVTDASSGDIWVSTVHGDRAIHVTKGAADDRNPAWSPDGTRLVFGRSVDGDQSEQLWIVNVGGSGAHALTEKVTGAYDHDPAWSPDGRRIAYSSSATGDNEIWLIDADGKHAHAITDNSVNNDYPDWSPDGGSLAFTDSPLGQTDIVVMRLSSGLTTNLTPENGGSAYEPAWSPDGTHIAYRSAPGATGDIFWRPVGGGAEQLLSHSSPDLGDSGPSWVPGCTIKGNTRANTLHGTAKSELICAGGGNDTVDGGGGLDLILLGTGDDRATGGAGNDVLVGGPGRDHLDGAAGSDLCVAGPGGATKTRCER